MTLTPFVPPRSWQFSLGAMKGFGERVLLLLLDVDNHLSGPAERVLSPYRTDDIKIESVN
jgi:hypothetical protein